MSQREVHRDTEEKSLAEQLQSLEERIARLELHLGLAPDRLEHPPSAEPSDLPGPEKAEGPGLEQKIGEFALAWVGSIIFLLGIVFLMVYTISLGYDTLASALGYLATMGFYFLSRVWLQTLPYISRVLTSSSVALLYFTTLRLHYFSARPIIESAAFALVLLLIAVGFHLGFALKRDSQWLAGLAVLFGYLSALLSGVTHIGLPLVVVMSALSVYLAVTRRWWTLLNFSILFAYTAHLLWLINNPVLGHPIRAVAEHQYNLVYLFAYAAIFSWPGLRFTEETAFEPSAIGAVAFNCLGFSALSSMVVMALFQDRFAAVYLGVALLFLVSAVWQWTQSHHNFSPSVYACFGYMALSVALYGYAGIPTAYFWLALQSLLVVSMSLWFRSKLLVVVNFFIFLGILGAYLVLSPSSNIANFTFAAVAHASARIMNWQKDRLTLRTKNLRNLYLIIAFIFVLYGIHHAVPPSYVTLSWTAAAVVYFLLSLLLRNIKYRWMAIAAVFLTILYLFLVDLARLDPRYRVAAFLFLGIIALAISLFYTRFRRFVIGSPKQ